MQTSTEKPHNCYKCANQKLSLNETKGNIRVLCRRLESTQRPSKKDELMLKLADLKQKLRNQQAWLQQHVDDATYLPTS